MRENLISECFFFGCGSSKIRQNQYGKRTHGHLVESLLSRVAIEEGVILCPDPVDAVGRVFGFVCVTCHGWVFDDELGLASDDVELPDTSQQ